MQRITGPKQVDLPVSVYGKLPFYKDFLRHALAGAECQAFKKWLDQGISQHWAGSTARKRHDLGTHLLFLTFPATRRRLLIYLWGSHDTGGLRSFPFAVFVSLPTERSGRVPLAHLDALGAVGEEAAKLRRRLLAIDSVEGFQPLIRTSSIRLVLQEPRTLEDYFAEPRPSVGDFARSLFPQAEGEDSGRCLRALLRIMHRLRGREGIAVRLPASELLGVERQAALWSLLLEAKSPSAVPLQVLAGLPPHKTGLTVIQRNLRSDDIFALHGDLLDYEYITDLRSDLPHLDQVPELSEQEAAADLVTLFDGRLAAA